jgi:predicted site-specific integrase-resolvase
MSYVKPKIASKHFKVSKNTLRTWSSLGKIKYITTEGGHRRYLLTSTEKQTKQTNQIKIIYSRVSSKKQKDDLSRQTEYLTNKYPDHKVITDIGSGINFERKGFKQILEGVFKGNISEVVVTHRDRFTGFGYSLFEWIFKQHKAVLLCDQEKEVEPKNELSEDLMSIITVFTARYYGNRTYKKRNTIL